MNTANTANTTNIAHSPAARKHKVCRGNERRCGRGCGSTVGIDGRSRADDPSTATLALNSSSSLLQGSELEMMHILESVLGSLLLAPDETGERERDGDSERDGGASSSSTTGKGKSEKSECSTSPGQEQEQEQEHCRYCCCCCYRYASDPERFPVPTPSELLPATAWNHHHRPAD
eukprot:jgi/Psemu1/302209/fgenesh1_kg.61_\